MAFLGGSPVVAEGQPITFRDQTVWLDPEKFGSSYMLNIDFDETCFTTFISKGDGVEVHRAYEIAVDTVLGKEAQQDFSNYGGLSNRAPLDVIKGLIDREPSLIQRALGHAQEYFAHPEVRTDIGLGLIARFADRGQAVNDELTWRAITEMLVIRKKEILIPQISEEWPMPVKGFGEFWHAFYTEKERRGLKHVHTAIVSSGHTDFIQLALEQAGLELPDVFMTDDEMRRQPHPKTKPDPMALQLVRKAWLNAYLIPSTLRRSDSFISAARRREVYIGDDIKKDGQMAANDKIKFLHHDGSPEAWPRISRTILSVIESGGGFEIAV